MTLIDKLAYSSKLAHVKAGSKLLAALVVMSICLAFGSPAVSATTIVLMSAATLFMGGCRLKRYAKLMLVPMAFVATGVLTIIVCRLGPGDSSLFSFRLPGADYGVTASSLYMGARVMLKALGAVTCLYFFSLNTPMNSFLSLLRRRFPGVLAELMELMYRFIFIIWDEAGRIRTAQASRLGYGGFSDSLRSLGELAAVVFIRAFRRADRIGLALESRGFEGNFEYLCETESSSPGLTALTALSAAALAAVGTLERALK